MGIVPEGKLINMRCIGSFLILGMLQFCGLLQAAPSQVEFVARVQQVENSAAGTVVTMELTPTFFLPVRLALGTELQDSHGNPVGPDSITAGTFLKVEAVFTDEGLLALEARITSGLSEFELNGPIQSIREDMEGNLQIEVLQLSITVSASTEVRDSLGNHLFPADLEVGQTVQVRGAAGDSRLQARQIELSSSHPGFAQMSIEGVVSEISGDTLRISINGGVSSLVRVSPDTRIEGTLAAGVRVSVSGEMNSDLFISARRIEVEDLFKLLPDELRMGPSERARVDLVLTTPSPNDLTLTLRSENPMLAESASDSLTIPAGALTASFEVESGPEVGHTRIDVGVPLERGGITRSVEVEVGKPGKEDENEPESELQIKWNPRRIQSAQLGTLSVQLQLNRPAPQDLTVRLSLKDGDPSLVSFPESVTFPAGSSSQPVALQINAVQGEAKIRATLPNAQDTDDLELELGMEEAENLQIHWAPDELRLSPGGSSSLELRLSRPAPVDFKVVITVREGDSSLLESFPAEVEFKTGEDRQVVAIKAGSTTGKVKFRAALPFELGGQKDDLEVEVR